MLTSSIALRPTKAPRPDQISDDDAVQSAERHADQGDDQRVLDRGQPLAEDDAVMVERQRVIGAERLDDRGVEQQRVEIDDDAAERRRRTTADPRAARRHRIARRTRRGLAGHGHIGAPGHQPFLREEDEARGHQQQQRQDRAALEVEHARDLQIGFGRQHRKIAAGEDQRCREVGERRAEQQQEGVGQRRHASGSVTVRNARQREAPRLKDASSKRLLIEASIGRSARYAIGK